MEGYGRRLQVLAALRIRAQCDRAGVARRDAARLCRLGLAAPRQALQARAQQLVIAPSACDHGGQPLLAVRRGLGGGELRESASLWPLERQLGGELACAHGGSNRV